MAIKLIDLRAKVQNNFTNLNLIKENLSDTINIIENDNRATLKQVNITQCPTDNLWIFNNENGEKVFLSNGKKVENTLLYLEEDNKKLYILMIELKSTFDNEKLIQCRDKFQDTLSHISVYILLNNHNQEFEDICIVPVGIVCYQREVITSSNNTHPTNQALIDTFKNYIQNSDDNMLITLETLALGVQVIPTLFFENESSDDNFEITFDNILEKI